MNPVTLLPFVPVAARGSETTPLVDGQIARAGTTLGAVAVLLPAAAALLAGMAFGVIDEDGNAATNNITVNGNGTNIDGAATVVLSADDAAAAFVYDGAQFRRVVMRRAYDGSGVEIELAADDSGGSGGGSTGASGQVQTSDGAGGFSAPANVLAGASFVSIGATPATSGALRIPNAAFVSARNAGNSADVPLVSIDASNYVTVGNPVGNAYFQNQHGGNDTILSQTSNGIVMRITAGVIGFSLPVCGGSAAVGAVDGSAAVAVAAANITLNVAQYSRALQWFTGAPAAQRIITYPLPASDDASYSKRVIVDTTVSGLRFTNGGGTTVDIGAGTGTSFARELWFSPSGVALLQ